MMGLGIRTLQLTPSVLKEGPDVAVSHGSRSQLLLSAVLRIPSVVICDYEFVQGLTVLNPSWVMVPAVIARNGIKTSSRILQYPGIKEDVYVPKFRPNTSFKEQLGLNEDELIVTLRPPANEAHYHNPESETLLEAVLEMLREAPKTKIVLLPRNKAQETAIRAVWSSLFDTGKMMVPAHAVDGLDLIWHSDLVISGGGTMNREAAALGVPVYSIFRGKIGAVDRYLAQTGRLTLVENVQDVGTKIALQRRTRMAEVPSRDGGALSAVVDNIVSVLESRTGTSVASHAPKLTS
jgi:hypothetical protein